MSNPPMDPAFVSLIKEPRVVLENAIAAREAVTAARQGTNLLSSNPELEIRDHDVPGVASHDSELRVRIYRRKNAGASLPVLLYLHGGGFFCGDLSSEESQCARYALEAQCAVVCVAYRLAPENPFPAALTDCYRALEFIYDQGRELTLDQDRIAVGGSSSGANLAAAVTLLARDRTGPRICFQMLLVPALDDRLETESARQFVDVPDFATPEAQVMWSWYLGDNPVDVSPYAAPARMKELSCLPTSYILCAGLDSLRDDGLNYARRLIEAGVAVELHLVPSIPHGFASVPSAVISQRLLKEQVEVLSSAFRASRSHS